jgi:mannose-6-phosphate isomerase-like protein (cupin superfamily)
MTTSAYFPSDRDLAVFEVRIPPGGSPPMLHRHDSFELCRVRSGELTIYIEGKDGAVGRTVAGPGAVVPIGAGLEHTVRNESGRQAEAMLVFFSAAGPEVLALARAHEIEITRSTEEAVPSPASGPAYLTITRFPGDPDRLLEKYREFSDVMSAVGRDHGLIMHAGAKTGSGFLVVNLWPSKDGSEAAARDPRRLGVIEAAEISPDQVHREHHDVADFVVLDFGGGDPC